MAEFHYEARDDQGQISSGSIEAESVAEAIAQLAAQALDVLAIRLAGDADDRTRRAVGDVIASQDLSVSRLHSAEHTEYLRRIDQRLAHPQEVLAFLRALQRESLSLSLKRQLGQLIGRLESGLSAESMLADERLVNWLPMVMMDGMSTDETHEPYRRWIEQFVQEQTRRKNWWATWGYPLVLVFVCLLVLLLATVFVVPTFEKMFLEFGLLLPTPTWLLIHISRTILEQPLMLLLGIVLSGGALYVAFKQLAVRGWLTRWFGWATAGNSSSVLALSRWSNILAELLSVDAPVAEAVAIAGIASRHAHFRRVSRDLSEHLRSQGDWSTSAVAHNFPPTALYAIGGSVDRPAAIQLLRTLALSFNQRVAQRASSVAGLMNPMLIGIVGLLVAFIAAALFMPLITLVTALT